MRWNPRRRAGLCALVLAAVAIGGTVVAAETATGMAIRLPAPRRDGAVSVEEALQLRRSVRDFADAPLGLQTAAQLLWAVQGTTDPREGGRTAPSAGATYPLELLLVAGRVDGLTPGVYRYRSKSHDLLLVAEGDHRHELARAALRQNWLAEAPAIVVIAAVHERTARRYGSRAERYVQMEVGHAGQNLYLQAAALELGTVVIGAFDDAAVRRVLGLDANERPLSLMPVGRPARSR